MSKTNLYEWKWVHAMSIQNFLSTVKFSWDMAVLLEFRCADWRIKCTCELLLFPHFVSTWNDEFRFLNSNENRSLYLQHICTISYGKQFNRRCTTKNCICKSASLIGFLVINVTSTSLEGCLSKTQFSVCWNRFAFLLPNFQHLNIKSG